VRVVIQEVQAISPAKFFADNRSIAGFGNPAKALYTSIRELVENSLDAAEYARIFPEIRVRLTRLSKDELKEIIGISEDIDKRLKELIKEKKKKREDNKEEEEVSEIFELIVADNGSGMAYNEIPILMGRVLTSTKYVLMQQRGRFGLGGKMVIIYSIQETNAPVEIWSARKQDNSISHYVLKIDLHKNEPIIRKAEKIPKKKFRDVWGRRLNQGTIIRVYILGDWPRSRRYILEYFKQMAIITPYATFIFEDPDGNVHIYERVTEEMPPPPKPTQYHLQGIDTQILTSLLKKTKAKTIKDFLTREFQRIGPKMAEAFLRVVGIDPKTPVNEITQNDKIIAAIVETARKFKLRSPDPNCLSPIGQKLLIEGIKKVLSPEFVYVVQRKPFAYAGHPMIVEIGIAYGGGVEPGIHLYRFANRVPLLYKEKSDVAWKVIESIDWSRYKIKRDEDPIAIFVSVVSTKIPFSETSKDFIDDFDILRKNIKLGLLEGLRKLKEFLSRKEKAMRQIKKRQMFIQYAGNIVRSISSIVKSDSRYKDWPEILEDNLYARLMDLIDEKLQLGATKTVEEISEDMQASGDMSE